MAPNHYLNQCWNIVNLTLRNKLQCNFDRNSNIFIKENVLEYVVCEMASILSRAQNGNIAVTFWYMKKIRIWPSVFTSGRGLTSKLDIIFSCVVLHIELLCVCQQQYLSFIFFTCMSVLHFSRELLSDALFRHNLTTTRMNYWCTFLFIQA